MIFPLLDEPFAGSHAANTSLGPEYLLNASGQLAPIHGVQAGPSGIGSVSAGASAASPVSTLVGASGGFQINLVWDNSVKSSANWAAIEASVVAAAQIYTTTFSSHVVLNIAVGLGEVGGTAMSSSALGESESLGYITNFNTVSNALQSADAGLIAAGSLSANHAPTSANFFVTSAEAKAIGLASATSTAIDGYIGIGKSSNISFTAAATGTIASNQYDAVGIAAHEISEVMGRIGMEGTTLGSVHNVETPLDLFRYTSNGVRDLTPTGGYFSLDGGTTNLGTYNNPKNGGDAADWASLASNTRDSYSAFGTPGTLAQVSIADLTEVEALGYHLSSAGLPKSALVA